MVPPPAYWTQLPCLFHLSLSLCWTLQVQWSTSPWSVSNSHATEMTIKRNWEVAVLFKPEYCTLDLDSQQVPACYNKDHKKKNTRAKWIQMSLFLDPNLLATRHISEKAEPFFVHIRYKILSKGTEWLYQACGILVKIIVSNLQECRSHARSFGQLPTKSCLTECQ